MNRAMVEHWSSGVQPWRHSSRLNAHFSQAPPECRHRSNRAVAEHWSSGSMPTLARHGRRAGIGRTEQSQRTGDTVRRAGAGYPGPKQRTQRPRALSWHKLPRLDAHSSMALAESWLRVHRAVHVHGA